MKALDMLYYVGKLFKQKMGMLFTWTSGTTEKIINCSVLLEVQEVIAQLDDCSKFYEPESKLVVT